MEELPQWYLIRSVVSGLAIIGVAAALRVWNLGVESLWLDEATSLVVAENPISHIVALTAEDIHPPLYYVLLRGWLIFGRSEVAIRSLSAVIGILSVAALYGLGSSLFGRRVGFIAAGLLAVSPLHIWYSQEARMYVLVALWAILSWWAMCGAWGTRAYWRWGVYVLATALGLYTHYYMGFVVFAQNLFVLWLVLRRTTPRSCWKTWFIAQGFIFLLFAPWLPTVVRQISSGGGAWVELSIGRPGLPVLWDTFIGFAIGPVREMYPVWLRRGAYVVYMAVMAGGAMCAARALVRRSSMLSERITLPESWGIVLLWCVVPVGTAWLASQWKPMYALRYALPFLPAFCLFVALSLDAIIRRRRFLGWGVSVSLIVLNVIGAVLLALTIQKPDWRGLTADLVAASLPNDVVLPEPFWNAKPLRYYGDDRVAILDIAPMPADPQGIVRAMAQVPPTTERLWLVEDIGHYGDRQRFLFSHLRERYELKETRSYSGIGMVSLFQVSGARE